MTTNAKAAPGGHPDTASEDNVVAFKVYSGSGKPKTGRTRYVRLFPERLYFLLARFTEREIVAYLRLLAEYVVTDGAPKDDGKVLARIVGLSARAWAELRTKLIEMGLAKVDDGRLVDLDQQASLDILRASSERQRERALHRWGKR